MNQWLRDHGGYAYGDSFVWASIQPFGLAFGGLDPNPVYRIALHLQAGDFVIANVMGGAHWVLATSVSNGYMSVNDPGFNKAGYGINEVVQFGWYSRTRLPINMGNWITGIREILGLR